MSVFEKIQSILIQTKLNIACDLRREYLLQNEHIESLKASKKQIEKMLREKWGSTAGRKRKKDTAIKAV